MSWLYLYKVKSRIVGPRESSVFLILSLYSQVGSPITSCLNCLHRLGFAFKRPKKRLLKSDETKRAAFVAECAAMWEESQGAGTRIFFADEAHLRADAELRGKWVQRGEPALVGWTSRSYGEKAGYYSAV